VDIPSSVNKIIFPSLGRKFTVETNYIWELNLFPLKSMCKQHQWKENSAFGSYNPLTSLQYLGNKGNKVNCSNEPQQWKSDNVTHQVINCSCTM